jgi:RNA recognition motif-containing protein
VPKKLSVGNLAYSVTDQDLKDLFSQSGAVESVAVDWASPGTMTRILHKIG